MRALFTQDMPYARPSSGGSVPLSPAVDADAVCQQICSTTILHQGSHTNTHQMKPQSTVPNYETAWRKKLGRHTMHQTRFLQSPYPIVQMPVKAMLPVEDNCKRSIKRYRPHLPTPAHLGELTIPAELTTTLDQDPRSSCTTMGKMPTTGLSHLPQKTISDS